MVQALFYSSEVNWVLYHFKVIRYFQSVRIDRIVKNLGGVTPPKPIYESLGCLLPIIIKRLVFNLAAGKLELLKQRGIFHNLGDHGTELSELLELLVRYLLVYAIPKNCQAVLPYLPILHLHLHYFFLLAGQVLLRHLKLWPQGLLFCSLWRRRIIIVSTGISWSRSREGWLRLTQNIIYVCLAVKTNIALIIVFDACGWSVILKKGYYDFLIQLVLRFSRIRFLNGLIWLWLYTLYFVGLTIVFV